MSGPTNDAETVSPGEIGHFVYCPRSWAVIATERLWAENWHTAKGNVTHARVDEAGGDSHTLYHVTVWSDRDGLYGTADSIEITPFGPLPVEYKSARRVQPDHTAQLAAQALCLEEMFGVEVTLGAIWLAKVRRKMMVTLRSSDKDMAREAANGVRAARQSTSLPEAVNDRRCIDCSLQVNCLPAVVADRRRVSNLHASLFVSLA